MYGGNLPPRLVFAKVQPGRDPDKPRPKPKTYAELLELCREGIELTGTDIFGPLPPKKTQNENEANEMPLRNTSSQTSKATSRSISNAIDPKGSSNSHPHEDGHVESSSNASTVHVDILKRLQKLKEDNEALQLELNSEKDKGDRLEAKLRNLTSKYQEKEKEYLDMELKHSKLLNVNKTLDTQNKHLEDLLNAEREQTQALSLEMARAQQSLEHHEREINGLHNENRNLTTENNHLRTSASNMRHKIETSERVLAENTDLRAQLDLLETTRTEELNNAQAEVAETFQTELKQRDMELARISSINDTLSQKLDNLESQLQAQGHEQTQLRSTNEQVDDLKSQLLLLKNQLSDSESDNQRLSNKVADLTSEKHTMADEIDNLTFEKDRWAKKYSVLEAKSQSVNDEITTSEKDNLKVQYEQLTTKYEEIQTEHRQLTGSNASFRSENQELRDLISKIRQDLTDQSNSYNATMNILKSENQELREFVSKSKQDQEQQSHLQDPTLNMLKGQLAGETEKTEAGKGQRELDDLQNRVASQKADLDRLVGIDEPEIHYEPWSYDRLEMHQFDRMSLRKALNLLKAISHTLDIPYDGFCKKHFVDLRRRSRFVHKVHELLYNHAPHHGHVPAACTEQMMKTLQQIVLPHKSGDLTIIV